MALDLSSSSTTDEIQDAFDDNADYDLAGSVEKAKDFIQAARLLLRRSANEMASGSSRVRDEPQKIQAMLNDAIKWWKANDATATVGGAKGYVRYASFKDWPDG